MNLCEWGRRQELTLNIRPITSYKKIWRNNPSRSNDKHFIGVNNQTEITYS